MAAQGLYTLSVVLVALLSTTSSYSCEPCTRQVCSRGVDGAKDTCREVSTAKCIPVDPDCKEIVDTPCKCCKTCALAEGAECHLWSKCESGLSCQGVTHGFGGTCTSLTNKVPTRKIERKEDKDGKVDKNKDGKDNKEDKEKKKNKGGKGNRKIKNSKRNRKNRRKNRRLNRRQRKQKSGAKNVSEEVKASE